MRRRGMMDSKRVRPNPDSHSTSICSTNATWRGPAIGFVQFFTILTYAKISFTL